MIYKRAILRKSYSAFTSMGIMAFPLSIIKSTFGIAPVVCPIILGLTQNYMFVDHNALLNHFNQGF